MAETRPVTLDDMARIGGVGAKKLESYGNAFLEVIAGEAEQLHPQRRKLAGRNEGEVYVRSADSASIERLIGERYAERFGDAFLEVLEST